MTRCRPWDTWTSPTNGSTASWPKTWPKSHLIRFRVVTSSDWTTFSLVDGATWLRPSVVSASAGADYAGPERGSFLLTQSLARAETGNTVEMMVDILLTGTQEDEPLVFEIERGHLGSTPVELSSYLGTKPSSSRSFVWDGIAPGERNAHQFQIPISSVVELVP